MKKEKKNFNKSNNNGSFISLSLLKFINNVKKLKNGDTLSNIIEQAFSYVIEGEGKNLLIQVIKENGSLKNKLYDIARSEIKHGNYLFPEIILSVLINCEEIDDKVPTFSFDNLFQSLLFVSMFYHQKFNISMVHSPISSYYYYLGFVLFSQNDLVKAIEMLDLSLNYNPIHTDALLLKSEILLINDMPDLSINLIKRVLDCSYKKKDLAKAYLQLAKSFLKKSDYKMAFASTLVTKYYDYSIDCKMVLNEVRDKLNLTQLKKNDDSFIKNMFVQYNIQLGPSKKVINALNLYISDAMNKGLKVNAQYYLNIASKLTDDKYYHKLLYESKEVK